MSGAEITLEAMRSVPYQPVFTGSLLGVIVTSFWDGLEDSANKEYETAMTKEDLQAVLNSGPFHHFMRMEVLSVDVEEKRTVLQLPYRPEYQRQAETGQVHGGIISAFIDVAGTFAVAAVVGHGVPTINLCVDYLRGAINTTLIATATVLRAGRTVAVVDIDLRDEQNRQIAVGRGTYGTQER